MKYLLLSRNTISYEGNYLNLDNRGAWDSIGNLLTSSYHFVFPWHFPETSNYGRHRGFLDVLIAARSWSVLGGGCFRGTLR
jgi:hypothetical protein